MSDLVFLETNRLDCEPFTTSDVIADSAEIRHHAVQQLIAKHESDLLEFGVLAFDMRKPLRGSKGGRPETVFRLNEGQATLLVTYLQNTPPVRQFKKNLVREFYAMRQELTRRQIERSVGKPIRRAMTDAIRDSGENERMHGHAYKTYTDLAYRAAVGQSAAKLRTKRQVRQTAPATDLLASDELVAYRTAEAQITMLLDMGLRYEAIKPLVLLPRAVGRTG